MIEFDGRVLVMDRKDKPFSWCNSRKLYAFEEQAGERARVVKAKEIVNKPALHAERVR